MTETYHGSCHCGAVAFEADIDLAKGTGKCNCSICMKTRNWNAIVSPDQFRLQKGADQLSEYRFGSDAVTYKFCPNCGVHVFSLGYLEAIGGDFVSVRVNCLDDAAPQQLADAPVRHADGRNDNWWNEPAITSIL
ncbi:Glutathione-dependent formaldehyde-activating enzyme [Labrenzia sp. THAF35]|uniref:GFA family protein n=1 Tax=Labrenzia sp. THAF35 TaxID=2587854 RepID=UPI0012694B52|nr:GFA family protein [Labrenzia sp. THAF35]QFT66719.1 Glutathione-dependent formaldehyde-activating enzyme [Labrenzia sp. THAF35]